MLTGSMMPQRRRSVPYRVRETEPFQDQVDFTDVEPTQPRRSLLTLSGNRISRRSSFATSLSMRGKWRKPKNDTAAVCRAAGASPRLGAANRSRNMFNVIFASAAPAARPNNSGCPCRATMVAVDYDQPKFIRILKHSGITICCTIVDRHA